nr:MAG TPA: hypothetical protein [Caudoviricetes sp.]DAY57269.1 MAG TPA: hypothetical protein [Caudoviricetes sp.]
MLLRTAINKEDIMSRLFDYDLVLLRSSNGG